MVWYNSQGCGETIVSTTKVPAACPSGSAGDAGNLRGREAQLGSSLLRRGDGRRRRDAAEELPVLRRADRDRGAVGEAVDDDRDLVRVRVRDRVS